MRSSKPLENGLPLPVDEARFQADADFNHKVILGLRRRNAAIDFQDANAGAVAGVPDIKVLSIAADLGRILVSHDRSTMPAHFA